MQVFVRHLDGRLRVMDVTHDTLPSEICPLGSSLVYNGHLLSLTNPLIQQHVQEHSTLTISFPLPGGAPKKKCFLATCTDRVANIIGHCSYCKEEYCGKHRLPEAHACANIRGCKQAHYERNVSKLMNEKCVGDKI